MNCVFADTYYFLALFNPRDASHAAAVTTSAGLPGNLVTTDWVLTETADALCDPINRAQCADLINDLRASPYVEIERASARWFEAGWSLYQQRPDKAWSLTDCISFAVTRERGIGEALTRDRHFQQAGFKLLLE